MGILNIAGGIQYHLKALRFWKSSWVPFRLQLETWGMEWAPTSKTCVMVGPSGGYCISDLWLQKFDRIIAWDPDPLAETFFKRIHSNLKNADQKPIQITWVRKDWLKAVVDSDFNRQKFLEKHKLPLDACFLFTNFLGQIEYIIPDTSDDFLKKLPHFLRGSNFLSFHDRLSSGLKLRRESAWIANARVESSTLAQEYYLPDDPKRSRLGLRKQILEVEEHDLDTLLDGLKTEIKSSYLYVPWQLRASRTQIIEGIHT
jgi:hypothetical protein